MRLITVSLRNIQTSEMEETTFPFTNLGALSLWHREKAFKYF